MNTILAVSEEGRETARSREYFDPCLKTSILVSLMSVLVCYDRYRTFADFAIEALSHLVTPLEREAGTIALSRQHADDVWALCLDALQCQGPSELWRCSLCQNAMHKECAAELLKRKPVCPYCRKVQFCPLDMEIGLCVRMRLLESFAACDLESEREFRTLLLLERVFVHDESVRKVLSERAFGPKLVDAMGAALRGEEWPAGSNARPLLWKLSIFVEHFARHGFATELGDAVVYLVARLCGARDDSATEEQEDNTNRWCKRALLTLTREDEGLFQTMVQDLNAWSLRGQQARYGTMCGCDIRSTVAQLREELL
eukprot:TRINITY_DN102063_c0_g1_i1.p1 TRINITY_DN102063_c0_g1~~TRINITY_DN102063_c0_g1_i1.p1  ORF type:complete len:314 (+),score=24.92 TRINITY_DN102063_c0_g1_i1:632-1573(+)